MLDQSTRSAILRLHKEEHGSRAIAKALGISRGAVKDVLKQQSAEVPRLQRAEKAESFESEIRSLYQGCKGNLVRVHEELLLRGATFSYQALTSFCRRHGIGTQPVVPVGHYDFVPGQEMQHDTSPHRALIGGVATRVETASLALCYSRMLFFQHYPSWNRFSCKLFLTEAIEYYAGAAHDCMLDNSHVVVLKGTGQEMVPVPEMVAFADRFGFTFKAHEKGDANRSARVERPFHFIENNFLAGRDFVDLADLNLKARQWCDKVNHSYKRHLQSRPIDLFARERSALLPLPILVPEVYQLHHRIVDLEGYVSVNGVRYSAPYLLIGRRIEARESKEAIALYDGPRLVGTHARVQGKTLERMTLPEHRPPPGERKPKSPDSEETALLTFSPSLKGYIASLKQKSIGNGTLALRRLLGFCREYPPEPLLKALKTAEQYGLYDLERVERLILKNIAADYFVLNDGGSNGDNEDGES